MKKFALFIIILIIAAMGVMLYAGCEGESKQLTEEDIDYTPVATVEDLLAMSPYGAYRMTSDIDFKGKTWNPTRVWAFNGGGHTIKNCTVTVNYDDPYDTYSYAGFFGTIKYLSDTKFENINVKGTISNKQYDGIGIAVGGCWAAYTSEETEERDDFLKKWKGYIMPDSYIKDVVVKNSSITLTSNHTNSDYATYIGGIAGVVMCAENCTIENCKINFNKTGSQGFQVGGAFGRNGSSESVKITSSGAKNVDISVGYNGSGIFSGGGFIAYSRGDINNCYATNCDFTAETTGSGNIGGFVGTTIVSENSITNCMSKDNSITFSGNATRCSGTIGGFAGYSYFEISNCLSSGNSIVISDTTPDSCSFNCAGFVGGLYTKGMSTGSAANSLAIGNNITNTNGATSITSGFYGTTAGAILYCGVKEVTLFGGQTDGFGPKSNRIQSCILDSDGYGNANDLNIISVWDEETLTKELRLSKSYWSITPEQIILTEFNSIGE